MSLNILNDMEAYEDTNAIMTFPECTDYTLDNRQLIHYFSRSYRHHCTSPVNRFLFSYDNDVIFITPIKSLYRIAGRSEKFKTIKQSKYFDTFFEGSYQECVDKFKDMIKSYFLILE